ncbi:hypothetical protein [Streptomyces sp. NBRC 109706]|uniref:hypothetical protein n=1 Tax=Streptomyces sp. NBRC 109706 TaxID=1550035 RepID=UPI000782472A|nr:hypothetical protein [Streptomyces sp. NBRC 109706]
MPATRTSRRSPARRAGESAFGALLLGRLLVMGLLAVLLLVAGGWASWDTGRHVLFSDAERGEVTLLTCDREECVGPFRPTGELVVLEQRLARTEGETLDVALVPGTDEVVRAGVAGVLYAFLPLSGALLLAAVAVGGGLRLYRAAWAMAGTAFAALLATFLLWI